MDTFAGWQPKMEVAESLGISERTLERLIQQKRIRRAYRRVPGRKPLAVLNPEDVAVLKSETLTATPENGTGEIGTKEAETALAPRTNPRTAIEFLSALLATIPQRPQS